MPFNADFFARQLKVKRAEMCATKPSFETICDLADALECSTDDFWERNERKAS